MPPRPPIATCSQGFQREEAAGRLLYGNYGMTAPGPIWNQWRRPLKNAANTSVIALDGPAARALGGRRPACAGPGHLETLGETNLDGPGGRLEQGQPFSAHPKQDPDTGDIYNFGVSIRGPMPG
jgi:carotenoid cleavage dioxygenase-like enzyme